MIKKAFKLVVYILVSVICIYHFEVSAFAEKVEFFDREPYSSISIPTVYGDDENISTEDLLYYETPIVQFQVSNLSPQVTTDLDYTDWWYSEWEDCHYIFLPATADKSNLVITYATENDISLCLNGNQIVSGEMTTLLGETDEFDITVGDVDCGKLKVMQSNLGCIYLTTSNGGLDALDSNKSLVETGSALMLNSEGGTEYNGELEKIVAHGNSSWDYSKKKPYNIKLPKKVSLYGMGKAKKWALLGNYLDHSMIRNKATLEMSRAVGMEYVMNSIFVDLYADGSYRGTYQLIERIQVQKNRVNIKDLEEETEKLNENDLETYNHVVVGASTLQEYKENSYKYYDIPNNPSDITGGYLIQFQLWNRYGYKAESGFVTSRGQAVEIDGPEYASKEQVLYIREFVQDLEDAIYSETGYNEKGKHYSEYIDMDSFITAYLIQEVSMNVDGSQTSFYFWKDSDLTGDGKLHCGPAWDFDLAYNNFPAVKENVYGDRGHSSLTDNLFIVCFPISGYDSDLTDNQGSNRPTLGIDWIGQLYKKGDIIERVAEIYFERFEPYISRLTDLEQDNGALMINMGKEILPSAEMNNARWHMYGGPKYCVFGSSSGDNFMENIEIVRKFLEKRKTYLTDLWKPYVSYIQGDVNYDGVFNVTDILILKKYLLGIGDLTCWKAGDLYQDNNINVFDLIAMKNELTKMS